MYFKIVLLSHIISQHLLELTREFIINYIEGQDMDKN